MIEHYKLYPLFVQVIFDVILSNVTLPNNLLSNLYFENLIIELYVLYVLNIHANFHVNWMLFTV